MNGWKKRSRQNNGTPTEGSTRNYVRHIRFLYSSERTVRTYMRKKKKELYSNEGYLPLNHPSGEV